jgi:DNA-binding NarL/FixJ family response regulator
MKKIKILIIEDNRVLREGLIAMIDAEADMHVVASIASGNNVVLKASLAKPHVILMDVSLKDFKECSAVQSIRKQLPDAKVVGMGFVPTQSDIVEFVEAGASGFILKDATVKEFLATVRTVAKGEKVLPPVLTDSLFAHVLELALKKRKGTVVKAVQMTKREREIIVLIADGMSNKDIAGTLNIATFTVKSHVHNILEKMALHSRLQIAMHSHDGD